MKKRTVFEFFYCNRILQCKRNRQWKLPVRIKFFSLLMSSFVCALRLSSFSEVKSPTIFNHEQEPFLFIIHYKTFTSLHFFQIMISLNLAGLMNQNIHNLKERSWDIFANCNYKLLMMSPNPSTPKFCSLITAARQSLLKFSYSQLLQFYYVHKPSYIFIARGDEAR